jgi:hypothetical protein
MERLDLLRVTAHNAEYLKHNARVTHDIELINRDAGRLNAEALDVLSYQDLGGRHV